MKEPLFPTLLNSTSIQIIAFLFWVAISSFAQNLTTIVTFNGTDGRSPYYGPLIQGRDGNLYGTTEIGGVNDAGTFFKLDLTTNTLTTVYNFCSLPNCTDGGSPLAGVILGTDGNFYGTTVAGGDLSCAYPAGCGTVFKITSSGVLTTLFTFHVSGGDGDGPEAPLLQGTTGSFYGTTGTLGGAGTIFRISPSAKLTNLHTFDTADGSSPLGGLIQPSDGNFYGTTYAGGSGIDPHCAGCGTVFKMTPAGRLSTLYNFSFTDGAFPAAGLVQAADGNLYGATVFGGANANTCAQQLYSHCGTIFSITPSGKLTTLYNFCTLPSCLDGGGPFGTLIQATDGNFYGTTILDGIHDGGTVFEFNPETQALNPFYSFGNGTDGIMPYAGLVQATNGKLYGTTDGGGSSAYYGTIFVVDLGLGSFVKPVTYSGKVGAPIEFLGEDFTKSSTVSFNGTPATPTGILATYLAAKVPSGATTGPVTITTSVGTLTSNKIFRVIPQVKAFNPPSGPVGMPVIITGVSLTQTSQVTIGGKVAASTVNSDTQVTATVPAGAKTGKIVVTTQGGSATAPGTFTVTP